MAEKNSGIRSVLKAPRIYDLLQKRVGTARSRQELVDSYVRPSSGLRLLDIGCGTASILDHLDGVSYTGFDPAPGYIESARSRYGDRGTFFVGRIGEMSPADLATFDVVFAKGVLHHLGDELAKELFGLAAGVLEAGGRLVTLDGCYSSGQSRIARFILSRDRGQNVRTAGAYEALARTAFDDVTVHVREDLLRVPYTHAILVCHKSASTA